MVATNVLRVFRPRALLLIEKTDEIAAEKLKRFLPENNPAIERIEKTGYVGSPETVASKILEKDETGISYIIFQCAPTTPTLEAFKEKVLPSL